MTSPVTSPVMIPVTSSAAVPVRSSLKDVLRVLVVDDMSVSRALLSQALDAIGLCHHAAEVSGLAAISRLAQRPAHLVLADMHMPGLSGLDLLEALRRDPATRRVAFILVTSSPTPELVRRGQGLGLNNLLRKPFTADAVRGAIERVVGPLG